MEKRGFSFYYDILQVWKSSWLFGLASGLLAYAMLRFGPLMGELVLIMMPIGVFLLAGSCYAFFVGVMSFVYWKVPMAELDDGGLVLHASAFGFRKRLRLDWSDIELARISKRYVKLGNPQFGWDARAVLDMHVLVLQLRHGLTWARIQEVKNFCARGLVDRHFKSDDQGTEIWVTKPPRGGFQPLLSALESHVGVREG
jgi:hypothetical protein